MEHYTQHPRRETSAQGNSKTACGVPVVFTAFFLKDFIVP